MNIAIFASAFHPSLGGVEELCRQLAHQLRRMSLNVIIVTEQWPRSLPSHEIYEGIPVYRFPMRVPDGSFKAYSTYAATTRRIRREIARLLVAQKTEVLHVQCVSSATLYALDMQKRLNLPLLVTLQGELTMDASAVFQNSRFASTLMRRALSQAQAITACSRQTLDEAAAFQGHEFKQRAEVVPNGIRLSDWNDVEPHVAKRPYILGIGRHVTQKGFDILLRAYAQLLPYDNSQDLVLAGDGVERPALEELSHQLGIAERVHFPGRVDRKITTGLFAGATFFVLPSRHEPLGIVNLEAMAAGTPVIAAEVGGVPEIVTHGENGLLFPAENEDQLLERMKSLLCDATLGHRLASNASERVRNYDWDAISRRYLDIYQTVSFSR